MIDPSHEIDNPEITPLYARRLVHLIRPFPNFDFFFIKSMRQKAVDLLQLKPGDRVLDAGCGPGGSFPYLVSAVGPGGEVVGVEISPETTINAQRRIEHNGWKNVKAIAADARTVRLEGEFDGLLSFAAPDVYASPQALSHLIPYLKDDALIVAFGGKLSQRRSGKIFNSFFRSTFSKLTFASTPGLNDQPWNLLKEHTDDLKIQEYFFGWMFMASGTIDRRKRT